jgi:hypothetical protein
MNYVQFIASFGVGAFLVELLRWVTQRRKVRGEVDRTGIDAATMLSNSAVAQAAAADTAARELRGELAAAAVQMKHLQDELDKAEQTIRRLTWLVERCPGGAVCPVRTTQTG